ncbi:MAG: 3-phenylpropionate/cinnamic acid dioxygenase subunit beta [Alphaproteobacteria bacterium]|nr:3-phenylpropionate/cinnamic acid dioxygenase subunit beta [Alphaproteobacteria bacterium]
MPGMELLHEVEQFLYREARLLDAEQFEAWLELLTEDIHYWMPAIQNRYRRDKNPGYTPNTMALFDEDMKSLRLRIKRFNTGVAWPEDPPTRHCHVITNIEVEMTSNPDEYRVYSAFVNHRSRNEQDEDTMMGRREDVLRRVDGVLKLARRKIVTTQSTIMAKNLSAFL